ncbi:hypothetical protein AAHC03_017051 [Spirometra sp. Aus1]|nr:unnamed protein product [Spirometra erinaceieuropaei]
MASGVALLWALARPLRGAVSAFPVTRAVSSCCNVKFATSYRAFSNAPDRAALEQRVLNVCKSYDKINPEKITLDSHFMKDLGLDSLDHIEVIMELENEFGLEIPDVEAEKLVKPSDVVELLYQKKLRRSRLE